MSLKGQTIKTAPFPELVAVTSALAKNSTYDLIIDQELTLESYCSALLEKIFTITQSKFPAFVNYQSTQVEDPIRWLNKFEKLLANNEELFASEKALSRFNKLYNLIELKRNALQSPSVKETAPKTPKKYINAESEDRYFSFYELKKQIEKLQDDNQKILLLTREKFEYQQANIEFINQKTPFYDDQCSKEIENIYALQKLQAAIEEAQKNRPASQPAFNKIKINCNLSQFVDVFYQFHRELFVDGKPIIDGNVNDMAAIIVNSFLDKDGKEISPETVKTILTPSRADKRPKPHKRLDVDKMLG